MAGYWLSKRPKTSSAATPAKSTGTCPPWRRRSWPPPATRSRKPARRRNRVERSTKAPVADRDGGRLGLRTTELLPYQTVLYVGDRLADFHHGQCHVHYVHRGWRRRAERRGGHRRQLLHDLPAHRGTDLELPVDDLRHPLRDGAMGAVGGDDR